MNMFSNFKFPTLRQKTVRSCSVGNKEGEQQYCYHNNTAVINKPPKTPTLAGSGRVRRHQRRRSEPGVVPSIVSLSPESVAAESDRFAPGDRLCSVNGIATSRLSNDELLRLLDNVEERASLEVEYYMPNYVSSQSSLYITSKVAEVAVERAGGPLGVTLRGGAGERPAALVVAHVRPGGAAYATSRIKVGDRLLKVDHISLLNKTLSEVHQILQNSPHVTSLTIEYDVSIMESVKLATGPLLVEIERPCNEDLGLFLTNQRYSEDCYSTGSETYQRPGCFGGVYIDSILPASISDRCGALHPGDQLLAFDDLVIENNNYTAEEVMCYLENCSNRGFTQLHIAPRHILQKNGRYTREHSMSGTSTLNTRKQRQNRGLRQSSVPKLHDEFDCQQNYLSGVGVCRTDVLTVQLDIAPNQDSGISVFEDNSALLIAHITHQSPAYRSGCLQARDRILCINGHDSLTAAVANDILQRRNESHSMKYINLKVEFTMANNIEASSGVFNVKLATNSAGLGVTITGSKQRGISSDEPMVISDIKTGSVAHRSGALAVGYQLLAINGQPLHNLSLDTAFNILQNSPDDIITLKIRKIDNSEDWSDVRPKPTQQTASKSYNLETTALVHYGHNVATNTKPEQSGSAQGSVKNESGGADERLGTSIFTVELKKQENGPLGLTIAGSEDVTQPILLSGLVEGGVAEKSGKLKIGDEILSINGESVLSKPLSEAIKLLQNNNQHVLLKISRKVTGALEINKEEHLSWPRDSNLCSNHSNSSPGLSNDSAVESWDQNTPVKSSDNMANNDSSIEYAVPDKTRQNPDVQFGQEATYSSTDEDKLLASGYKPVVTPYCVNQLPLPNYSLNNSLKSFHYDNKCLSSINTLRNKPPNGLPDDDSNRIEIFSSNSREIADKLRGYKCDYVPMVPYGINVPSPRTPTRRNWEGEKFNFNIDVNGYGHTITQKPPIAMPSTSYQMTGSDNEMPGLYNTESITPTRGSVHHVILYKDAIYDDYGFSVSDGLYERGVYINRIRKGGPADIVGLLRPYDRILQVNGTRTVDYDCCMTVPLIASAGDRLEIVIHRLKESHPRDDDDSSQSDSNIVTKTI